MLNNCGVRLCAVCSVQCAVCVSLIHAVCGSAAVCSSAHSSVWQCLRQYAASLCGSARMCAAVNVSVCGSAHSSVWQCLRQCAAVRQRTRQCAAVCGSAAVCCSSAAVCGSVQQCGSVHIFQ